MFQKRLRLLLPLAAAGIWFIQFAPAQSSGSQQSLHANLHGTNEIPAVSTKATGEFKATIRPGDTAIDYEISYADLSGNPTQSHIHFGQKFANGGIVLWLCQSAAAAAPPPLASTPTCPASTSGTVTGTLTPTSVNPVATQQIAAGEFAEVLAAIRAGNAYANIHTVASPAGEVRGQLKPGQGVRDADDHPGKSGGKGNGKGHDTDDDN